MKAVKEHTPDEVRPSPRRALPFRIVQTPFGPQMEWEEEIVVGLTQARVKQPMVLGHNMTISWLRLQGPLLTLVQMFRELEGRCDEIAGENDRLRIEVATLRGEKRAAEEKAQQADLALRQRRK